MKNRFLMVIVLLTFGTGISFADTSNCKCENEFKIRNDLFNAINNCQNKTSDAFYRDNVSVFDPSSVFASSTGTNKFVAKTFYDDINTKKFNAKNYFEQICLDEESYK